VVEQKTEKLNNAGRAAKCGLYGIPIKVVRGKIRKCIATGKKDGGQRDL